MKLARPLHLLVLVGFVAGIIGFASPETVWAVEKASRLYVFGNGALWGDPSVGYICRGTIVDGKEKLIQKATETLRVYGEMNDKVILEQNVQVADPAVFNMKVKEFTIQFITKAPPDDFVEWECVASKNGEVTNQFTIRVTTVTGEVLDPMVTPGAVAFVLDPETREISNSFPGAIAADSATNPRPNPWGSVLSRGFNVTSDPESDRLTDKPVDARLESSATIAFSALLTRRALGASSGVVTAKGIATSDMPEVAREEFPNPGMVAEDTITDDHRIHVGQLPHTLPGRIPQWKWHKRGFVALKIGEERTISLDVTITAEVTGGNTLVELEAKLDEKIARLKAIPPFPF